MGPHYDKINSQKKFYSSIFRLYSPRGASATLGLEQSVDVLLGEGRRARRRKALHVLHGRIGVPDDALERDALDRALELLGLGAEEDKADGRLLVVGLLADGVDRL